MYLYIVAWFGSDINPQYEVVGGEVAALKLAKKWTKGAEEGMNALDILRMDLRSPMKLQRRKNLDKKSTWEDT